MERSFSVHAVLGRIIQAVVLLIIVGVMMLVQLLFFPQTVQMIENSAPFAVAAVRTRLPDTFSPLISDIESTETPLPTRTPRPIRERSTATPYPTPLTQLDVELVADRTVKQGMPTPIVPIPPPVSPIPAPDKVTNILILGSDSDTPDVIGLTDTMIVVSINHTTKTASMISIPRDIYVYMPGWTMYKINAAVSIDGPELLKQTILYNFGIPIHYYAHVHFNAFRDLVDVMDGVDVPVTCRLEDWRLKSPELDITVEENYERFALDPNIHQLDGHTALWYARSRVTTSDLDRGRRQQQLLRAIVDKGVDAGLITQAPKLWRSYQDNVATDMDIGRFLQLASIAEDVRANGIQHIYLTQETWTPQYMDVDLGATSVRVTAYLPNSDVMRDRFGRLYDVSQSLAGANKAIGVEIINASGKPELGELAVEAAVRYGFRPTFSELDPAPIPTTSLTFNGPNLRGSNAYLISWLSNLSESDITLAPQTDETPYYTWVLGEDYDSCRPELYAPQPFE